MNNIHKKKIILLARNEGKLKSYDSCFDLRAWSHDMYVRDRYLREWMKCNMPSCVFPISTISNLLKSMSCRHFGRVTPRCHPDCKSKKVLESICASCQAMKECLKINEKLENFFEEEELETGHWPCDKCLNALKSIKMFWKVILNKIFRIDNIPAKPEEVSKEHSASSDCVHNVAKLWQKEILEQAAYVKNLIPSLPNNSFLWKNLKSTKSEVEIFPDNTQQFVDKSTDYDLKPVNSRSRNKYQIVRDQATAYDAVSAVRLFDIGCDPVNVVRNENIKSHKFLRRLDGRLEIQINEVEELKRENNFIKNKLLEGCRNRPRKTFYHSTIANPACEIDEVLQPFDTSSEETFRTELTQDKNSEVMITVKNYKNEDFKHVCMLQVVHKTNKSTEDFVVEELECCKKQDPIDLLTKVQKTFGNIVRKELTIANKRHYCSNRQNIKASFGKKSFNTATSCTTMSTNWSRY